MPTTRRSLVVLVEPAEFFPNKATMADNYFQAASAAANPLSEDGAEGGMTARSGINELRNLEAMLKARGVLVARVPFVSDDPANPKPDAIFPNNSFSMHVSLDGKLHVYLWPMSPGRMGEVPEGVFRAVRTLEKDGNCIVHDFRHVAEMNPAALGEPEDGSTALEGTGALVFSPDSKAVFVGRSRRASEGTLRMVASLPTCTAFRAPELQRVFVFDAFDPEGRPVYHTNVVGWCGSKVAAWCMDAMKFSTEDAAVEQGVAEDRTTFCRSRTEFTNYFAETGVKLLSLSFDEMNNFAGNCLELFDGEGKALLTMSAAAWHALSSNNRDAIIEAYGEAGVCVVPVHAIETFGGGSIRCMQAHLNFVDSGNLVQTLRTAFAL